MPKHEFGIMDAAPVKGQRFDKYQPEKYNCISVDDAYIFPLSERLSEIPFYWHTLDVTGRGFAYRGITLIAPQSAEAMTPFTENAEKLKGLNALLKKAVAQNCFVIHFGI